MTRRDLALRLSALTATILAGCSPLAAFNALAPRDPAIQAGRDIAYGPDPRQRLDVYAPPPGPGAAGSLPVLVFFYGGGWNSGRRQDYAWVGRSLASRGFLVIVPDYRVYPQVQYPAFVQDSAAAVRWVHEHAAQYGGDPQRILLSGHSAGAYIALQLTLDRSFLRQAGVDPGLIKGAAGLSGPYDFYPFVVSASRNAFGAWPDPRATQPINHVGAGAPPIFLGHGDKDQLVALSNTVNLAKALTAKGDPVEVKIYAGLDHPGVVLALSRLFRGKAPVLADMTDFLKRAAG